MKTTQILYLLIFVGIITWIVTSKHLDDEGFESLLPVNSISEPVIAKGVEPTRLSVQVMPNSSTPGTLPFGPYGQMASVGSFPYQDPALLPAELEQMKKLYEDIRGFLGFEGASVASSSDPTVQLPLTQLRADSGRLQQEIAVLKKNPGIQASLTQQDTADIQGALSFLQRKVRLFQTSGLISNSCIEGFEGSSKTRATQDDLRVLQSRLYSAFITLSASGTTDPVVQARVTKLQKMYTDVTDMIKKLDNGTWKARDIPVYQEDINGILPKLSDTGTILTDILSSITNTSGSSKSSGSLQDFLINSIGEDTVKSFVKSFQRKGSLRVNVELGYNAMDSKNKKDKMEYSKMYDLLDSRDSSNGYSPNDTVSDLSYAPVKMDQAFDDSMPGAEENNSKVGGLDWKNRAMSICEQVRQRGLDPQDFGCIANDSKMSPAYSWRGYAKMVCGRLGATMDPNLPVVCGCPPQEWKGWNTF